MLQDPGIDKWIAGFRRRDPTLNAPEEDALRDVFSEIVVVEPDVDIVAHASRPTHSHLVLDGWAFRYISLADGRRQIVAIHLPGDFVDLHSFPIQVMDHAVATFMPCRLALAPHARLRTVSEAHPHLARLFWLSTLIDAAIHRQWLLGVGQRTALEQAAHRICELYVRADLVGLVRDDGSFLTPMSQTEFGDSLGVSAVHTNRVLQELRAEKILSWGGGRVAVLDWDRLSDLAEFDPVYLNLFAAPR